MVKLAEFVIETDGGFLGVIADHRPLTYVDSLGSLFLFFLFFFLFFFPFLLSFSSFLFFFPFLLRSIDNIISGCTLISYYVSDYIEILCTFTT